MKNIYALILFSICLSGCTAGVKNSEQKKYDNKCTLVFSGIKEFPLDDETSYLTSYMQLVEEDSVTYFSFLNTHMNAIYLYDYNTSEFRKRILYHKEGNHGVGAVQGYCYVNSDSIFLNNYWTFSLYLTNSKGEVYARYKNIYDQKVGKNGNVYSFPPFVQTLTPLKKYGQSITAMGLFGDAVGQDTATVGVCTIFNIADSSLNYVISPPEQYEKYSWGVGFAYLMPTYDMANQSLIVSFSNDHYIVEYSLLTGEQKRHYAGSAAIAEIRPYSMDRKALADDDKSWEWYMRNPGYWGVFYDKYKKLYYRIARLPVKEYHRGDGDDKKPIVVVVLDSAFSYVGEVTLPSDKRLDWTNCCFVSKDGFNIQSITDNEDVMTFYQYNFISNEK